MGGTVAETIRKKNGEVIKMARRTGAYNWMMMSQDFCEGNIEKAIDAHVKVFLEMKEDYETGEPYKFAMSPAYGWCNQTNPEGYGLVVLDFKKRTIHTMQGYDTPGEFHIYSLTSLDEKEHRELNAVLKKNLFIVKDIKNKTVKDVFDIFGEDVSIEKIDKISLSEKGGDLRYLRLIPKTIKAFKYYKYEETPQGCLKMFNNLKKDDFKFTEEEINGWVDYFKEYDLEYFLDESIEDEDKAWEDAEIKKNLFIENFKSSTNNIKIKTKK